MTATGSAPSATAPGKVLLAGEYAVLEGAEAVVLAVDRRVRASVTDVEGPLSAFLSAVREQIVTLVGADHPAAAAAARIAADSSALCAADGTKLGIGSSAAVTVAAVAAALAGGTRDAPATDLLTPSLDLGLVHRVAHRAHAAAQAGLGARGSGADIAASVHGGVLAVRREQSDLDAPLATRRRSLPRGLELVFVWSGKPAQTARLVARVLAYRDANPEPYRRSMAAIDEAACALVAALEPTADPALAVSAIAAGGEAAARLGRETALEIETALHRRARELAARCGGAFKPTGAGGGDMGVAAFAEAEAALCFRHDAAHAGISVTELSVDPTGVRIESMP